MSQEIELARETARRKFMQQHNRGLGWGFDDSGLPHRAENAGVMFTSEGWSRPYERFTLFEKYADHGGDREATEKAVIDKAITAHQLLVDRNSENANINGVAPRAEPHR